ncbi:MAG: translation initiation factor IF-2 [Cyclobacteriaceae bacterium]
MAEEKTMRLSQVARKLNVGRSTIVDFLSQKGFDVDASPNSKINMEQFRMLSKEFAASAMDKEEASGLTIGTKHNDNMIIKAGEEAKEASETEEEEILIKDNLTAPSVMQKQAEEEASVPAPEPRVEEKKPEEVKPEEKPSQLDDKPKLQGIKVVGKIDLDSAGKPKKQQEEKASEEKPAAEKVEEKETITPVKEEKPVEKIEEKPAVAKETAPVAEKKEEEKPVVEKPEPVVEEKKAEVKEEVKAPEKPKAEEKTKSAAPTEEKDLKKEQPVRKSESVSKEEKSIEKADGKSEVIEAKAESLRGLKVLGKIELPTEKKKSKPVASSDGDGRDKKKRPRKRIPANREGGGDNRQGNNRGPGGRNNHGQGGRGQQGGRGPGGRNNQGRNQGKRKPVEELTDKEIQDKIKATLAKLSGGGSKGNTSNRAKYRKEKRNAQAEAAEERMLQEQEDSKKLKVTEFISASDLASLMEVSVNDVISTCMSLGMFVSINQRLDAESITIIADEFGYEAEFTSAEDELEIVEEEDLEEDLSERAPIVTIMGHVDHGKTSLLDYIRDSKVTEGEAGGITQHIGAYDVMTNDDKRIAFLDTPGHEAFTAMRARGAKITDIVIIVVAADDNVMPQTKEAINHAQVAGVPIVIAINKIDKPNANPDKIKEELSQINILVEDWGGKYQCQEISAKTGQGIDELLEKVLLEAELLELTANSDKKAAGSVIEATLDKGRGYVTTIMVQSGTLKIGDVILAGPHYGKVKAMTDHRGKRMNEAGPSTPVQMLGLDGAPQAGDKFNVMDSDREAREIANKREQIVREQSIRTKKHITLDEIGRRLAIGTFKELNVIVKGDVDGSIEALSDSLLKLSTDEVQVNIIHKAVGQISESDVLLASASDAVIVGFQVRPSGGARRIAENEEIEIRLYSIIYDAINDVRDAMEGMLAPTVEEVITGNIEVREVFKISKVGTVAGCYVTDGYVKRNNQVRLVRDGIVVYTGEINQLKRYKDDVSEVKQGYECGISIKNFNDIKEGDVIEGFEEREVKRTL